MAVIGEADTKDEKDYNSTRKVQFGNLPPNQGRPRGTLGYNPLRPTSVFRMKVYYSEAVCDGAIKTYPDTSMMNILSPSLANRSNFLNNVRKKFAYIGLSPDTKLVLGAIPPIPPEFPDMSIATWLRTTPGAAIVITPESEMDTLYQRLFLKLNGQQALCPDDPALSRGRPSGERGTSPYSSSPSSPKLAGESVRNSPDRQTRGDPSKDVRELQEKNWLLQRELDRMTQVTEPHLKQQQEIKDRTIQSLEKRLSMNAADDPNQMNCDRAGASGRSNTAPNSRSPSPPNGKPSRIRHRPDQCLDFDRQIRELQDRNGNMGMELEHMGRQVAHLEQQSEIKDDTIQTLEKKLNECMKPHGSFPHLQGWEANNFEKMNTSATMKEVYRRMFLNAVRDRVRTKLARVFPSPPGKVDFLTVSWADVLKFSAEIRDLQVKVGLDKVTLKVTVEDIVNTRRVHGNTGIHIGIYADMVLNQDPLYRPAYKKLFRFLYDQDAETVRNNLISSWT